MQNYKICTLLVFLATPMLANGKSCQIKPKDNAEKDIALSYKKIGHTYDFSKLELKFPSLPSIFECIDDFEDFVDFELKYKITKSGERKFQSLKKFKLINDELEYTQEIDLPKTCSNYRLKLVIQNGKGKINFDFKTGPGPIGDFDVNNITDSSAKLVWPTLDESNDCVENLTAKIDGFDPILKSDQDEVNLPQLEPCHDYEIKIVPIFDGKEGSLKKKT